MGHHLRDTGVSSPQAVLPCTVLLSVESIFFLGVSDSSAETGVGGENPANLLFPSYFDLFNCPLLKHEVIK